MKSFCSSLLVSLPLLIVACTEPGKSTAVGAATGGVIGAGLGAIVGNQVGSPGAGLAIGAAAGASAGAAVGNAFDAQDKRLAANEEAINRKDETIRSQSAEIQQLRSINRDTSSGASVPWNHRSEKSDSFSWNKEDTSGVRHATPAEISEARARLERAPNGPTSKAQLNASFTAPSFNSSARSGTSNERPAPPVEKIEPQFNTAPAKGSSTITEKNLVEEVTQPTLPSSSLAPTMDSSDCEIAKTEVSKAEQASDSADKLFHLRRALRQCPSSAEYHNKLGELYSSLNRKEDAQFEFNEALKVDPGNERATANLEKSSGRKETIQPSLSRDSRY